MTKVLLVEDNPGDAALLRRMFASPVAEASELDWVTTLAGALERLARDGFGLVLLDLSLPDSAGVETFTQVQARAPHLPIVVLSGLADEALAREVVHQGAQDYVVKNHLDRDLLLRVMQHAIERKGVEEALRRSEAFYHSLVESLPQNILRKDLAGRFTFANQRCLATFGVTLDELVGKTDYDLFPAPLAEKYRRDDRQVTESGQSLHTVEEHVTPDGAKLFVEVVKTPILGFHGEVLGTQVIFWDVTEQKLAERRLAAQHRVTAVLAESATLSEATPRILQAICESLAWDLGAIWALDAQAGLLRCVETWHQPTVRVPRFEAVTHTRTFERGIGLPGRVWASGQPAWIPDVTQDANFPRAPVAAADNLHGAFGFPILLKGETIGVVEFFSHEIRQPDDKLLQMMANIGSQLGQFMERRRAEEMLRDSEQRLQSILHNTTAVIYVKDRHGRYILINRQYETLFHISRDQVVGKTDYDLFPAKMADAFRANDRKVLEAEQPLEFEEVAPHDDGPHTYISIKFPLYDTAGVPYAVCGISTDINDRKRAEEALIQERYLLHVLMDNVPDAIYFKDPASRFIRINRALAQKNGLADPAEALGKTDSNFFTAEHAEQALADEQEVMQTGQPLVGKEEKETWPDGHETWVLTTKLPLRDEAGKIVGTFGISRDITTRKQAEEALRVSERRYRQLTEGTRDAIVVGNEQGLITLFNPAAQKAFGYTEDEVLGQPLTMLMPEQYHAAHRGGLARYLQTREPRLVGRTLELEGRRKNGQVFPLELSLCAVELPEGITFMGTIRDITERRRAAAERQRMQARVIQAEKLASLGLLSAGVAHEINNPLAYVANNLAVLERDVRGLKSLLEAYEQAQPALESARPDLAARTARIAHQIDLPYVRDNLDRVLETTRQGIQRVADIVQSLRGFARIEQAAFAPGDIHEDILSSLEMIRGRLNRRNISVQQRFGQLPPVACAHGQINQVFLNLLVNAMHAIQAAGRSDGHIEIATRAADGTVVIEVADNGCGITPEQLQRIFDPFYTTKPVGEGTGLGLSISHSIVSDHGGRIEVESTPGEGSRFRVILPVE